MSKGTIKIIGIGPGAIAQMTRQAIEAIESCEVIIGYDTYIDLIAPLVKTQEIMRAGMTEEVERAQNAIEQAQKGRITGIISSGDAGLYGMAGLVYEVLREKGLSPEKGPRVEVIPGITAMLSSASLLGAPLMHDACTISLSDHLTPWEVIAERLEAAASADFTIALYNPKSRRRKKQLEEAIKIIGLYRDPKTPVGVVTSAYRENQSVIVTTLEKLPEQEIGMLTTLIIGNSTTQEFHGKMITPRGYQRKYRLDSNEQQLHTSERLHPRHEPWALAALEEKNGEAVQEAARRRGYRPLNELRISPGFYERTFTGAQMSALAALAGNNGELTYTPDHHIILRTSQDADEARKTLLEAGVKALEPALFSHENLHLKVCDFCEGQRREPHSHLGELYLKLSKIPLPREVRIGYTGCGMSCYGAAMEDIGIIYSRGKFEVYAGAKKTGKIITPPQKIEEEADTNEMIAAVINLVEEYSKYAQPGERFYKFMLRRKSAPETEMEKI